MSRNASRTKTPPTTPEQPLTYSPPTTFVALPSEGKFYPPDHPLHGKATVEVKQMTTREEEILTSPTLLKQGLIVDRLIESVLTNSEIDPSSLLIGDKNAMLVALRIDAYGEEYDITVPCPICGTPNEKQINLSELKHKVVDGEVETTDRGTFVVALPRSGASVELRLLTGDDEQKIAETNKKTKKYGLERPIATQYSHMVASVNGDDDQSQISNFVSSLPAFDSRIIRNAYKKINPDVDMNFDFQCDVCSHEQGMEVPITAKFFWSE